jgi:chemotaxis response regulator CheB
MDEAGRSNSRPSPPAVRAANAPWLWLALGASTGGPAALRELLAELAAPLPLRVVIVQHIAHGREVELADWLAVTLGFDVRVALHGDLPQAGSVRLAPGGAHLQVGGDGRLALDRKAPPRSGHRPSVDELFLSLAASAPRQTAAVLLTGMGSDGAVGLAALRRAGAFCIAQDEASSAISGMPRAARELDAAELALPPDALGRELARRLAEQA